MYRWLVMGERCIPDTDLCLVPLRGMAFQKEPSVTAEYDEDYWKKCAGYEGSAISDKIHAGRIDLVARYAGDALACDVGIGSGEFIRQRPGTKGIDINPKAIDWLKSNGLLANDLSGFDAVTFWDVIEHVPEPQRYLGSIKTGSWAFFSVPIFKDLFRIRESRHYRPGEHLYYWTEEGFIGWLRAYGFFVYEVSSFESDAGRDMIYSFAARKEHGE